VTRIQIRIETAIGSTYVWICQIRVNQAFGSQLQIAVLICNVARQTRITTVHVFNIPPPHFLEQPVAQGLISAFYTPVGIKEMSIADKANRMDGIAEGTSGIAGVVMLTQG
jgi:hypothetical protein